MYLIAKSFNASLIAVEVALLASGLAKAVFCWFVNCPILTLTLTNPSKTSRIVSPSYLVLANELKVLVSDDLKPLINAPPSGI